MTTPCCGTPVQCEHPDTECLIRAAHERQTAERQTAERPVYHSLASPVDPVPTSPLGVQVGGSHYKDLKIQPVEYIHANNIPFIEGSVVKYISRHRSKNGAEDVKKAIHFCQLILKLEYGIDT